jgi:hypothetical protein
MWLASLNASKERKNARDEAEKQSWLAMAELVRNDSTPRHFATSGRIYQQDAHAASFLHQPIETISIELLVTGPRRLA